ncbi:conserved hypothetical protein [Leishmania infantum JPCM5]|uniref:Uncharacterized protein n=3 Tax=Leishmania donovani species complex TaxID=38574 RepID=A4I098_LEIIN|nr:conserved hypothetical protein [Leishmania infantum JPCM5]CAM68166.1 conserved hypothetical protein [Leishmania infantum JPCM5]|eukprot:XP_001465739.1 conserved hypothetical protein [Leishmania infantum JPCM5]
MVISTLSLIFLENRGMTASSSFFLNARLVVDSTHPGLTYSSYIDVVLHGSSVPSSLSLPLPLCIFLVLVCARQRPCALRAHSRSLCIASVKASAFCCWRTIHTIDLLPLRCGSVMIAPTASAMRLVMDSAASDNGNNSSVMQTPVPPTGTTLFLREEGSRTFVPVYHQSSVTLRDLAEEFNISSVLECDAHGNVQPRAVAFDSPSDVLHSGRHYIARRDARAEAGNSYVTFRGKILVKEYELEHPTPPASRNIETPTIAGDGVESASLAHKIYSAPAATPFPDKPSVRQGYNEEDRSSISRALALSSERKRPREDASRTSAEGSAASEGCQQRSQAQRTEEPQLSSATLPGSESVLQDCTNGACAPLTLPGKSSNVQSSSETAMEDISIDEPAQRSLRFIPFSETASDGSETYVTLEDLQRLCQEAATQEEEFQKRHNAATDILESARRVLFTTGEVD